MRYLDEKHIGKELIVYQGDFKGVRGTLVNITIEKEHINVERPNGIILKKFGYVENIICGIKVNNKNTISVSAEDVIILDD